MSEPSATMTEKNLFAWVPFCLFNSLLLLGFSKNASSQEAKTWIRRAALYHPLLLITFSALFHFIGSVGSRYDSFYVEKSCSLFLKLQVVCFVSSYVISEDSVTANITTPGKFFRFTRGILLDLCALAPAVILAFQIIATTLQDLSALFSSSQVPPMEHSLTPELAQVSIDAYSSYIFTFFVIFASLNACFPRYSVDINQRITNDPMFGALIVLTLGIALILYLVGFAVVMVMYTLPYFYVFVMYAVQWGTKAPLYNDYNALVIVICDSVTLGLVWTDMADAEINLAGKNDDERHGNVNSNNASANNNSTVRRPPRPGATAPTSPEQTTLVDKSFGNDLAHLCMIVKFGVTMMFLVMHFIYALRLLFPFIGSYIYAIFFTL